MPIKSFPRFSSSSRYTTRLNQTTGSYISNGSNSSLSWNDTIEGVDLPDWKGKIARRENATTLAKGYRYRYQHTPGEAYLRYRDVITNDIYVDRSYGRLTSVGSLPNPTGLDANGDDTRARLSFLSKYRKSRTAFSSGVFLGELRETLSMLVSATNNLGNLVQFSLPTLKKLKTDRSGRPHHEPISNAWLETVYGWKPAIHDVNELYSLLYQLPDTYRKVLKGKSRSDYRSKIGSSIDSGFTSDNTWTYDNIREDIIQVRYKGAIDCNFEKPVGLAEFVGLDATNLASTLWNLQRYSFLVDYFTNIGALVDAMSLGYVRLAWGCRSQRKISKISSTNWRQIDQMSTSLRVKLDRHGRAPVSYVYGAEFVRTPVTMIGVGLTDLQFRLPGVDSLKWANVVALSISSLYSSLKR